MHEASIAQGVLDTALAALAGKGHSIARIKVVAGVLASVESSALQLYFGELSKGTAAQGAELEVLHQPATLTCRDCGHSTAYNNYGDFAVVCPKCKGPNSLTGGNELYIESMEIEE